MQKIVEKLSFVKEFLLLQKVLPFYGAVSVRFVAKKCILWIVRNILAGGSEYG